MYWLYLCGETYADYIGIHPEIEQLTRIADYLLAMKIVVLTDKTGYVITDHIDHCYSYKDRKLQKMDIKDLNIRNTRILLALRREL